MMEAIAHLVRAFPADRARHGQPYVAFELDHGAGDRPASSNGRSRVRCEPRLAVALDGALSAAYPDVRLGRMRRRAARSRAPRRRASPGT